MAHAINWFEIPVVNFERAKKFYETIIDENMDPMDAMGMKSAFFPAGLEQGHIGGCIIQGQGYEVSDKGSLIYLNGGENLNTILSRVEDAGGKVLMPKTNIGAHGFMAQFKDSEGNKIGLHSRG